MDMFACCDIHKVLKDIKLTRPQQEPDNHICSFFALNDSVRAFMYNLLVMTYNEENVTNSCKVPHKWITVIAQQLVLTAGQCHVSFSEEDWNAEYNDIIMTEAMSTFMPVYDGFSSWLSNRHVYQSHHTLTTVEAKFTTLIHLIENVMHCLFQAIVYFLRVSEICSQMPQSEQMAIQRRETCVRILHGSRPKAILRKIFNSDGGGKDIVDKLLFIVANETRASYSGFFILASFSMCYDKNVRMGLEFMMHEIAQVCKCLNEMQASALYGCLRLSARLVAMWSSVYHHPHHDFFERICTPQEPCVAGCYYHQCNGKPKTVVVRLQRILMVYSHINLLFDEKFVAFFKTQFTLHHQEEMTQQ
jgi:hypothetical protein